MRIRRSHPSGYLNNDGIFQQYEETSQNPLDSWEYHGEFYRMRIWYVVSVWQIEGTVGFRIVLEVEFYRQIAKWLAEISTYTKTVSWTALSNSVL
jgi:hypothetical protein